jgi:hypothetical protein
MSTVLAHPDCAGFALGGPEGRLGWIEETWLREDDLPHAYAVRTVDGRRALLEIEHVMAVDPDAAEVFVGPSARLLELDAPRFADDTSASWRLTGGVVEVMPAGPVHAPRSPSPTPGWRTAALALGVLATLVLTEIGLAFGVAYLVTGHLPY